MQQKIYPQQSHGLDVRLIDKDALYVLERLTSAGHIAYLVGGGIRDLLLKKTPKDYDISTSASPETIRKLFRNCILIGRRFRLAHLRFGKKIIEVSTFRSGDNEKDELIIRDNNWGTPEEDVLRRDFTINGLFYDAASQSIIDYIDGFKDLEQGHLRTIGQPFIRFKQDPVRMLRLLKFKARFGFSIDPAAHTALIETKQEILKSAPARILEELLRMLESGSSSPFFSLLIEYGFLQLILPAIADFMETPEGKEIYTFLQEIDEQITKEKQEIDRSILLSCLIYPLFNKRIQLLFSGKEKPPHLGEIARESFDLFHESFECFFHIPKRLKVLVTSIITLQFRLTPLDKKKHKTLKIPNDPAFGLALSFLKLRAKQNPKLAKTVQEWIDAGAEPEQASIAPSKKRRKPRRRRPIKEEPHDP